MKPPTVTDEDCILFGNELELIKTREIGASFSALLHSRTALHEASLKIHASTDLAEIHKLAGDALMKACARATQ